ncbi:marine proteobacterial sortase target protein [Paralimibaculum aggregatum]|uniref:Marine proteobacterial sortase target protein n=1 Tax=Paralimibaculum aggregatum TaxID=3036245 RepID=A0ABQ6LK03_9RHOB|nr:marine proteobacterial sortase target protein [Limibaculum sp. NKW23]GMG81113.1 marine proteobacterial sortase target protein [Limibaculum sp. NKW23]
MTPRITRLAAAFAAVMALAQGTAPAQQAGAPGAAPTETPAAAPALLTLDDVRTGRLMLRTDEPGKYVPAPLVSTKIDMQITGTVARATVTQRFTNPTEEWVEGIYAFPLPEDSAVDTLRMRIGDRFIEGEIKERQEAKEIYEAAKAEGKKAALVEQERPNLFTNSVANIGPGEVIVTQIAFQQSLAPKDGRWEVRMPLVVAPRYNPSPVVQVVEFLQDGWGVTDPVPDRDRIEPPVADPRAEPAGQMRNPVQIDIDLAPGFDIATLESPSHEITVAEPGPGRARIALAGPAPADRDFLLRWAGSGAEPQAALFAEEKDGQAHMLLMLTAPELGEARPVRPREVIFVQDVSGSMSGESIEQAREGLEMAVKRLRPEDAFNIVIFNDQFAVFHDAPVPASPENIAAAVTAVRALEAEGGTEMLPALDYALSGAPAGDRLRQVIFLTDGAVGNEAQMLALIDEKLGETRLFTVGIGSAPNSYFMSRAAEKGRGAHVYIGDLSEVAERMTALFTKIETPAITDLELRLPEGVTAEVLPSPLPDLYAGEPLAVALRGPEIAGEAVLSGMRGAQPWQVRLPLDRAAERAGVAKLYARRRIASLEALRLSPAVEVSGMERLDREILDTALGYGLVSRLTSLVAVDVTPSRPRGTGLASAEVPLNLPKGWDPEAFLFETPEAAPQLDRAMLQRIAPQRTQAEAEAAGAPVPKGALNWRQSLLLGLLLMVTGLFTLVVTRLRRVRRPQVRAITVTAADSGRA